MLSSQVEPRAGRGTLSPRVAYAHVAAVIGLALFASGTPSPLYSTYRLLWDFSPVVLTLIYATYAFGVLAALLLAGRVSDEIGRRPVLLTSLGTLMATSVVFMLADSTVWLFVARGIQGLATGLALGAASAALLDLHPRHDPASVALANGVASAGGMGLGIGISSLLVELAPAPRVLPYVVLLVLFAVAFYGALRMPEPVQATGRAKLTPKRPRIPPAVRRPFLLATLAAISSWSIAGLFISLGPVLGATLLHTDNHFLTALGVVTLAGAGAAAQLAFGRSAPWAGTALGSLALATGMVAMVIAYSTGTMALYWFGAVIGGAGFGVAFLGGLRALSAAIPPQHRAEVMSAFYIVAYLAISLPAVLAGVLVTPLGLESTFEIFGSVVAALALAVAFEAYRTRPATERLPSRRPDARPRQGSDPIGRNGTPRSDRDRAGPPQVGRIITDRVELARPRVADRAQDTLHDVPTAVVPTPDEPRPDDEAADDGAKGASVGLSGGANERAAGDELGLGGVAEHACASPAAFRG